MRWVNTYVKECSPDSENIKDLQHTMILSGGTQS